MDRRKTILIAVLVNAGLLVLLFIVGLHQEESPVKSFQTELAREEPQPLAPLFSEFKDLPSEPAALPLAALEEIVPPPPAVHQLPPLAAAPLAPPPTEPRVVVAEPPAVRSFAEVTVKKGDTLEKIARLNKTSVEEIIRINSLSSSFLKIGQVLKLPLGSAAHQPPPLVEKRPIENSQQEYYTVKVGDNPWTIAMKHHLKVEELLKLNNLNEEKARRLKPGDRLRIK